MFKNCLHDWKQVGIDYVQEGFFKPTEKEYNVIYCPLCHKEDYVSDARMEIEMEKIKVRNEYYKDTKVKE